MKTALAKKEIVSALASRFGGIFEQREKRPVEILSTGIADIDAFLDGFPRGAITEIHGSASSGRTSLLLATLTRATTREETCALIDCSDTFDPSSTSGTGMNLDRVLWIRCAGNLERAFKATDLLLQSGGFGVVALNLADVPAGNVRRIISSWWFRFRRALENTLTAMVVITPVACTRSCAALVLELSNQSIVWPSTRSSVSENFDAKVAIPKRAGGPIRNRSLITDGIEGNEPPLAHVHLLGQIHAQVKQERPLIWTQMIGFKASAR